MLKRFSFSDSFMMLRSLFSWLNKSIFSFSLFHFPLFLLTLPTLSLPRRMLHGYEKKHNHLVNVSLSQPEKQQPPTIDENCATGSNNSHQQTGNGDIPQQHAPPLQVRKHFVGFIRIEIIYVSKCLCLVWDDKMWRMQKSVNKTKPSKKFCIFIAEA